MKKARQACAVRVPTPASFLLYKKFLYELIKIYYIIRELDIIPKVEQINLEKEVYIVVFVLIRFFFVLLCL